MTTPDVARTSLREIALLFLKLGTIAFGGPAAHIAMMEDEVVRRRRWLTREQFLDYVGATNFIPGPNSTELALHIGHDRAGWKGLIVAGVCFIVPAVVIVAVVAWAYVRFGALPQATWLLYGVKPVVIAIIAQSILRLGASAIRTRGLLALGVAAALGVAIGVNEIVVLAASGGALAMVHVIRRGDRGRFTPLALMLPHWSAGMPRMELIQATVPIVASSFSVGTLFLVFLKVGSLLFGSGYVLLAFLQHDLVDRLGWLSSQQLLDAIAVGQITPGPVFTTATFIGYILGGAPGAAVATAGIFLPAFIFVAVSGPLVPRLRRSRLAGAVLNGVNVASLALIVVVTIRLARDAVVDSVSIAVVIASAILLLRFRLNSAWLVLGGAMIGLLCLGISSISM